MKVTVYAFELHDNMRDEWVLAKGMAARETIHREGGTNPGSGLDITVLKYYRDHFYKCPRYSHFFTLRRLLVRSLMWQKGF